MRKTSIFSVFGYSIPMNEGFKLIKQAGFDGVLLWWGDEFGENGDKYTFPDMARREGLFIENIHAPFIDAKSLWLDNISGVTFERLLRKCITDCAKYEIPTVIIHPTSGDTPPEFSQTGLDRFKRLVDIAEKKNVNIALENLKNPEYLDFIFSNIQSDKLGFCFDSGHKNCYTKHIDLLEKFGKKLMALHLHDNDGTDDQHRMPFKGSIDWNSTMKQIEGTGYGGAITLEVTASDTEEDNIDKARDYLEQAYKTAIKLVEMMN